MRPSRSSFFKSAAVLCLLALLLTAGAGFVEAGRCFDALKACMGDPMITLAITGAAYCVNGYYFCIRYMK